MYPQLPPPVCERELGCAGQPTSELGELGSSCPESAFPSDVGLVGGPCAAKIHRPVFTATVVVIVLAGGLLALHVRSRGVADPA